ncbi:MAG: hypothetical protein ACTSUE_26240 [Promethearchaeota archaeon]
MEKLWEVYDNGAENYKYPSRFFLQKEEALAVYKHTREANIEWLRENTCEIKECEKDILEYLLKRGKSPRDFRHMLCKDYQDPLDEEKQWRELFDALWGDDDGPNELYEGTVIDMMPENLIHTVLENNMFGVILRCRYLTPLR